MTVIERFDPEEWLSLEQAATRMGVSATWTHILGENGSIRVLDTALGRLYYAPDVEAHRRKSYGYHWDSDR